MSMKTSFVLVLTVLLLTLPARADDPVIVDHRCVKLTRIPATWIDAAKADLHIAYGHTSHGSQVTSGMTGLVGFIGGCGGPQFAWNNGGTGGALDLHDGAMPNDCGYYPDWVDSTRAYLDDPANADVNVIIWSWCGQVSGYTQQDMIVKYLDPMTQLEIDYPNVTFVYMTGHLNYWLYQNTTDRNQQIRDYCLANGKVLYDFADIESYDPDGTFFPYANDNCDYYQDLSGTLLGNWALEWQASHVENVDWYDCYAAHSQPLNANQKAYAAWWLWARIAGWSGESLHADREVLSVSNLQPLQFDLSAGSAQGGRYYALLGTASGTTPGFPLPGGMATLPLNFDAFTDLVIGGLNSPVYAGFLGVLDGAGQGSAVLNFLRLPAKHVGKVLSFAYLLEPTPHYDFASNAVSIEVVP